MAKVQCSKCKQKIDSKAEICPWCGTAFTPEEVAARPEEDFGGNFKAWLGGGLAVLVLLCGCIWWFGDRERSDEKAQQPSFAVADPGNEDAPASALRGDERGDAVEADGGSRRHRAESDEPGLERAIGAAVLRSLTRTASSCADGAEDCAPSHRHEAASRHHRAQAEETEGLSATLATSGALASKAISSCFAAAFGAVEEQTTASHAARRKAAREERRCSRSFDDLLALWGGSAAK